jgi:hypothetical protein
MKTIYAVTIALIVLSSCSTTNKSSSTKAESKNEKKIFEQGIVKNAVETRRYIIKLDRIFLNYGGRVDLVPRANYIIIDGEKAIINTAYLGRQYDIKPIVAINMRGRAQDYALSNTSKGSYDIKMTVINGGSSSFSVYLTITKNGSCTVSVSSLKIDSVRYTGYLEPIPITPNSPAEEGNKI